MDLLSVAELKLILFCLTFIYILSLIKSVNIKTKIVYLLINAFCFCAILCMMRLSLDKIESCKENHKPNNNLLNERIKTIKDLKNNNDVRKTKKRKEHNR